MTAWWHFVLAIAGALAVTIVALGFLIASWHGIDRRQSSRQYSGPDRRRPKTGERP